MRYLADNAPVWVDAASLRAACQIPRAITVLERMFSADDAPTAPPRSVLETPSGGTLLLMPASHADALGVKVITVNPNHGEVRRPLVQGVYTLFDSESLAPIALLDGAELTRIRTAAVSGVATRHLARSDSSVLVVFGAGVQAEAHVEAMQAVLPIAEVLIVGRSNDRRDELVSALRGRGVNARPGKANDVRYADVICTCTNSSDPVFEGIALGPGTHINAIGSHGPSAREIDEATVVRARVVVEDRRAILAEAGDLMRPLTSGRSSSPGILADLRDVVRGYRARRNAADITLFASVGIAEEDLALAIAALRIDQSHEGVLTE